MAYEYNLRGLFRPRLDQLPLSEQVVLYQQRDMTASHLLRVGASLFESRRTSIRKRMIDSSYYYSSSGLSPHSELFNRRLNDGYPHSRTGWKSAVHSDSDCNNSTIPKLFITSEDLDVHDKWIADRQRLRGCIEGPDALKHWLRWKEQTPMESYLLTNLHARKVSNALCITTKPEVWMLHRANGMHLYFGRESSCFAPKAMKKLGQSESCLFELTRQTKI